MIIRKDAISRRHTKVSANSSKKASSKYIKAAGEFGDDEFIDDEEDGLMDAIDDVADNVEDLQDTLDDVDEDEVEIEINNNIADHFIAECDRCHGIFISAVVDSDQEIDHVSGICPLCGKDSDQYLKWIIRSTTEED